MPGEDAVFIEFDAPNSQATALDPQEDAIMTLDHSTREEPRAVRLTKALVWPLMVLHILSAVLGTISIQSMGPGAYFEQYLPPEEFEDLSPERLDAMFSAAQVWFIGFAVFNVVVFVIIGLGLRADQYWARFAGLVLAILFLISAAYTLLFATSYGELSGLAFVEPIMSWIIVFVTVWWISQALDKRTGQWFADHREVRSY